VSDSDDLVRKTDVFLSRYRPPALPAQDDFPVLTEAVSSIATAPSVDARKAGRLTQTELYEIEQELRQQLLGAIGPYVENFIEESLRVHLESHLQRALASFTDQVRADIETLVHDAVARAIELEIARLRPPSPDDHR
jgi:hypothetical protein